MLTRRRFLEFLSRSSILSAASLASCSWPKVEEEFPQLKISYQDSFQTLSGIQTQILIKCFDPISKTDFFGQDNDFIGYIPFSPLNPLEGFLWVNHEIYRPQFLPDWNPARAREPRSPEKLKTERYQVGGSLLHVKKTKGQWSVITDSAISRRYTGDTEIPFSNNAKIKGSQFAKGTLGNCCGGVTPWGTFLTCEENYHHFYGETIYDSSGKPSHKAANHRIGWDHTDPRPPEHYGWVNEINPRTGHIEKIIEMGRFAHEGATVVTAPDGRVVVYMGDDAKDECFYKFVSDSKDSLKSGTLYVANTDRGIWIPLSREKNSKLKLKFKTQQELLIRTREAAHFVGGTPMDRPEDCEVNPLNGDVFLTCTNNDHNPHGHILKISEKNADPTSITFTSEIFLRGGKDSGFTCPDNLAFDKNGNLWMVTDADEEKAIYNPFGHNSLYFIPTRGRNAGRAFRIATGPRQAELTGLCFAPDNETLFLSVQHPGSLSKGIGPTPYTSHWPEGGNSMPKSAVVALSGPGLQKLMNSKA